MKLSSEEKRALEAEKDIYDLIPRFKGMHGHFLADRSYEQIRKLAHASKQLMADCCIIMRTYDRDEVHTDIQDLMGY